jgi:hypothetical protein
MGELSCKKAELMIEELLDDRLDEPGRAALDDHLLGCGSCQGYRRAAVFTRDALASRPLLSPSPQVVDRMWLGLERRLERERPRLRPVRIARPWLVAAASVALAAGVAALAFGLLSAWPRERSGDVARRAPGATEPAGAPSTAPAPVQDLVIAEGSVEARRDGAPVQLSRDAVLQGGDALRTAAADGVAVLRRGDQVRLALGPDSSLDVERLAPESLEVDLGAGWLAGQVEPGEQPLQLRVRTPAGVLRVVGTIFAVEVSDTGSVEVRVARGEVAFTPEAGASPVEVETGRRARFPAGTSAEVGTRYTERDEALLQGRLLARPDEIAAARADVEELFERAEAARRLGQPAQAAALYRQIASADPRGASGGTALISLGQLSLGPLGQPAQARGAFSTYLASRRRPLRQEAYAGLLRAQLALGQAAAARRTARQYLDEYPGGRYRDVAEDALR